MQSYDNLNQGTLEQHKSAIDDEYKRIVTLTAPKPDDLVDMNDFIIDSKNRYHDIIPKNKTRVILNDPHNNYINANWITSPYSKSILTQAPLEETIQDFWKMIWEQNVKIIVMVTNIKENGRDKSTFYWGPSVGPSFANTSSNQTKDVISIMEHKVPVTKKNKFGNITISTLELIKKNGHRKIVNHVYFPGWNDFGTPKSTESIQELLKTIDDLEKEYHNDPIKNPIVYHCSAGIGRSGTLLAIRNCMEYLRHYIHPVISEVVTNIRLSRPYAIQTPDQYAFIYKFIHFRS